jgi:hypothetical protein
VLVAEWHSTQRPWLALVECGQSRELIAWKCLLSLVPREAGPLLDKVSLWEEDPRSQTKRGPPPNRVGSLFYTTVSHIK